MRPALRAQAMHCEEALHPDAEEEGTDGNVGDATDVEAFSRK